MMGLPFPHPRTLRDHAQRGLGSGKRESLLGRVNAPNILAFCEHQRSKRSRLAAQSEAIANAAASSAASSRVESVTSDPSPPPPKRPRISIDPICQMDRPKPLTAAPTHTTRTQESGPSSSDAPDPAVGPAAPEFKIPYSVDMARHKRARADAAAETLVFHIAVGWDETDFDDGLYTSTDGHYTCSGDVDLSAIGLDDPKPVEKRQRSMLQPLDELIRGGRDCGAMQLAITELSGSLPALRASVRRARRGYKLRRLRYDKRNRQLALRKVMGKRRNVQKKRPKMHN